MELSGNPFAWSPGTFRQGSHGNESWLEPISGVGRIGHRLLRFPNKRSLGFMERPNNNLASQRWLSFSSYSLRSEGAWDRTSFFGKDACGDADSRFFRR